MFQTRWISLFFLAIFAFSISARGQVSTAPSDAPATQPDSQTAPDLHKTDLLGPKFTSHAHGIEFCPPSDSTQVDSTTPDSIVEFDRDDHDWRFRVWSTTLQRSLPLSIHKDQYGNPQDGVMEVTLANIKGSTPNAQIVRNEVINVGKVRVGMIAVRYESASHDRRYTQQAIVEAPNADNKFYYFFDLTGPGKPQLEAEDVINPAEKAAYDTFSEVIDSLNLLDRTNIVDYQNEGLYATRNLFVMWNGEGSKMLRAAIVPEQYQRIIKDGQDIGYQHIMESYDPNLKSPEESMVKIWVRSRITPNPLQQWDTETWMYSSAGRKHEHWKTAAECTNKNGKIIDSFSQIGASDEENKPTVIQPKQNEDGSLLPQIPSQSPEDTENNPFGPVRQGNVEVSAVRPLEVTTVHRSTQLNPFRLNVPPFYVPQALSYMLPRLVPLRLNHYMFAVFVPNSPESITGTNVGNVMARYIEVLGVEHVNFHGQSFDAVPITDKIGIDGTVTTYYMGTDSKFLGSTTTYTEAGKSTTVEIVPTDTETLGHIWNRPDLSAPNEPAGDSAPVLPAEPQ